MIKRNIVFGNNYGNEIKSFSLEWPTENVIKEIDEFLSSISKEDIVSITQSGSVRDGCFFNNYFLPQ